MGLEPRGCCAPIHNGYNALTNTALSTTGDFRYKNISINHIAVLQHKYKKVDKQRPQPSKSDTGNTASEVK
ncbi:Os06g0729850 [Oryza sativa Japonica Group]|uniref:Os06g0729850 protein n=1 Tax=Oryza sativa subsp. japonica TaxID=39947 RepID=A0A0P0X187_ORYSJ|nr:Os06g0729850 [Oryza sativa Japonica Group]